jgi:DNA-binding CsgD family transcriptional regulator
MDQLTRIEWKLDQVLAALAVRNAGSGELGGQDKRQDNEEKTGAVGAGETGQDRVDLLGRLTTKQHAAFQMLLAGASNRDIARRFGVTENTAKVYVRGIASKIKVRTRSEIVMRLWSAFRAVDDETYRMMSGGLPKDWHTTYSEPDPFADLYRRDSDGA